MIARVPAGVPLTRESRCPRCDAPIRWWQNVPVLSWLVLRGRCAGCRAPISWRYPAVELGTALVYIGVTAWWLTDLTGPLVARLCVLGAYLWFAAAGIALTLIDLDVRRLPHTITTTTLLACGGLLMAASLLMPDVWAMVRALVGMAVLWGFYAVLRLIRPDGMGGGDVRLAASVGLMLGWLGWAPLLVGAFAAFLLGGLTGIGLMLGQRAHRRTALPFGPWIIVGAWVGAVVGEPTATVYLAMIGVS
ncbi:A24 family peptidase [Microbacterium sediminicola]|uniref:A24 family peptidase n=1 Tax=Microbacterium sediminicola TaxID=415210 RepID=A0ABP4UAX9_9MICO